MTDEETIRKLMDLRLNATMAEEFPRLAGQGPVEYTSFSEQVAFIVDWEWGDCENRRLARLMRAAEAEQSDASLENVVA